MPTSQASPPAPTVDVDAPLCDSSSSDSLSGHCYHHNPSDERGGAAETAALPEDDDDDDPDSHPLVHMYTVATHSPAQPPATAVAAAATASQSMGTSRTGGVASASPLHLHIAVAECRTALLQLTHKHGEMAAKLTRKFGNADRTRYMSSESLLHSPPPQSSVTGLTSIHQHLAAVGAGGGHLSIPAGSVLSTSSAAGMIPMNATEGGLGLGSPAAAAVRATSPMTSGGLGGGGGASVVSPTAAVRTTGSSAGAVNVGKAASARQSPADFGHRHRDPEKPNATFDPLMSTSVTSLGRPSPHARELAAEVTAHLAAVVRAAETDADAITILQPLVVAALQAASLSLRETPPRRPAQQRWPAGNTNIADANESLQHTASASTAAESIRSLQREPAAFTATAAVKDHQDAFDDGFTVNQYLLVDKIGGGAQGEVFVAEDTTTGETRAVKAVRRPAAARARGAGALAAARSRQAQQLEREVAVMRQCRHRNIVALHEVIDDPDHDRMYLVMQYVDAGAIATISPDGACSEVLDPLLLTQFARQLCAGLQYLHGHGVIHRDIKPDNILRGRDGTVYLSDFGVSELFELGSSTPSVSVANASFTSNVPVHGTRGTVAFMAPELFSATETQGTPGEAVDVWALGVTFYALLYGKLPFDLSSMNNLTRDIMSFDPVARIPVSTGFGSGGASPPEANADVTNDGATSPMSQFAPQTPRFDDFQADGTSPRHGLSTSATRRGSHIATAAPTPPHALMAASLGAALPTFGVPVTPLAQSHSQRRGSGSSYDAPRSQTFDSVGAAAVLTQEWQLLLREMLCPDPVCRIQTGPLRRRVRAMAESANTAMSSSVFATSAFIGGLQGGAAAGLLSPSAGPAQPKPISSRWQLNER